MTAYQWNAEDYEKNSQAQKQWATELIAQFALTGTEQVLDLGCGDGKITANLAHRLPRGAVVGIDNSEPMISLATANHPPALYPNLSFQVMDAGALAFDNRFELVFSNAVLHWVKHHQPVIDGIYRSLKLGGKMLLRMGGKGDAAGMVTVIDEIRATRKWSWYFTEFEFPYTFLGADEYRPLLANAGFHSHRIELLPRDMTHAGESGLKAWIRTTWLPYTTRIPENDREEFIAAVCARYLEQFPLDAEGNAHVAMMLIEVEAEKN